MPKKIYIKKEKKDEPKPKKVIKIIRKKKEEPKPKKKVIKIIKKKKAPAPKPVKKAPAPKPVKKLSPLERGPIGDIRKLNKSWDGKSINEMMKAQPEINKRIKEKVDELSKNDNRLSLLTDFLEHVQYPDRYTSEARRDINLKVFKDGLNYGNKIKQKIENEINKKKGKAPAKKPEPIKKPTPEKPKDENDNFSIGKFPFKIKVDDRNIILKKNTPKQQEQDNKTLKYRSEDQQRRLNMRVGMVLMKMMNITDPKKIREMENNIITDTSILTTNDENRKIRQFSLMKYKNLQDKKDVYKIPRDAVPKILNSF